jgi:hypothetical protein
MFRNFARWDSGVLITMLRDDNGEARYRQVFRRAER